MKELYYTDSTIDHQAQVFLKKIMPLRAKHDYQIKPKEVALLVVDCQQFFFDKKSHAFVPSAQAIIPKLKKLQDFCYQKGIVVIHTRHINTQKDAQMMSRWWGDHLPEEDGLLTEIIPELVTSECSVIKKSQYDAFYNSSLEAFLHTKKIKQVIITGVMTNLCCETTARSAFIRGLEVFFSVDGTATYNKEFHLGALINLAHGFAIPMLVEELLDELHRN